jgi:hypothetical protein
LPHLLLKKILTSVTHVAEAAAVTVDARVVAMVAAVVTKETVAVDAQAAVVETASLATSQSAASTAPAKHKHFKASPLTFGLAAMLLFK